MRPTAAGVRPGGSLPVGQYEEVEVLMQVTAESFWQDGLAGGMGWGQLVTVAILGSSRTSTQAPPFSPPSKTPSLLRPILFVAVRGGHPAAHPGCWP